jgi:hypothetical protein
MSKTIRYSNGTLSNSYAVQRINERIAKRATQQASCSHVLASQYSNAFGAYWVCNACDARIVRFKGGN